MHLMSLVKCLQLLSVYWLVCMELNPGIRYQIRGNWHVISCTLDEADVSIPGTYIHMYVYNSKTIKILKRQSPPHPSYYTECWRGARGWRFSGKRTRVCLHDTRSYYIPSIWVVRCLSVSNHRTRLLSNRGLHDYTPHHNKPSRPPSQRIRIFANLHAWNRFSICNSTLSESVGRMHINSTLRHTRTRKRLLQEMQISKATPGSSHARRHLVHVYALVYASACEARWHFDHNATNALDTFA